MDAFFAQFGAESRPSFLQRKNREIEQPFSGIFGAHGDVPVRRTTRATKRTLDWWKKQKQQYHQGKYLSLSFLNYLCKADKKPISITTADPSPFQRKHTLYKGCRLQQETVHHLPSLPITAETLKTTSMETLQVPQSPPKAWFGLYTQHTMYLPPSAPFSLITTLFHIYTHPPGPPQHSLSFSFTDPARFFEAVPFKQSSAAPAPLVQRIYKRV